MRNRERSRPGLKNARLSSPDDTVVLAELERLGNWGAVDPAAPAAGPATAAAGAAAPEGGGGDLAPVGVLYEVLLPASNTDTGIIFTVIGGELVVARFKRYSSAHGRVHCDPCFCMISLFL